jgi:hypothetical protein
MRYVLAALAVVGGLSACRRAPGPTTPENKAQAPDFRATAEDELGFLPATADMVAGIDMMSLRRSQLWQKFEPMFVSALGDDLTKFRNACGFDPLKTTERITIALKERGPDQYAGVIVIRGVDTTRVRECLASEVQKSGGKATTDRGVVVVTQPNTPGTMMAVGVVGASTMVIQMDAVASYDSLNGVLASGAPLRKSPAFMALQTRREAGASVWFMANGNSKAFDQMRQLGMSPKSLDGTLTVTDRFAGVLRMTMGSAGEAAKMQSEFDKIKAMIAPMVDKFETRANGDVLAVEAVITEQQLRSMLQMLSGAMGGP